MIHFLIPSKPTAASHYLTHYPASCLLTPPTSKPRAASRAAAAHRRQPPATASEHPYINRHATPRPPTPNTTWRPLSSPPRPRPWPSPRRRRQPRRRRRRRVGAVSFPSGRVQRRGALGMRVRASVAIEKETPESEPPPTFLREDGSGAGPGRCGSGSRP